MDLEDSELVDVEGSELTDLKCSVDRERKAQCSGM
jgi:hypothetical protein